MGWGTSNKKYIREKILKASKAGKGYLFVALCKNSKIKSRYVHRLVYEAFNGKIDDGLEINHKDFDKTNNNLNNLEVGTHKHNMHHAIAHGRVPIGIQGEDNRTAVLNEDQVREIKKRLRRGDVQRRIAEDYNVCYQNINNIKQGLSWKHIN